MKLKENIVLLLFCVNSFSAICQWEKVFNDTSNLLKVMDVHFNDPDNGVAIFRTDSQHPNPLSTYVMKTNNGGQTWDTTSFIQDTIFMQMDFINQNTAYAVAKSPSNNEVILFQSNDNGENWLFKSVVFPGNPLEVSIEFFTQDTGVVSLQTSFSTSITYDGGQSWSNNPFQNEDVGQYNIRNQGLYAGCFGQVLYYSTDTLQSFFRDTVEWGGSANGIGFKDGKLQITATGGAAGPPGTSYGYPYFNFGVIAQYDTSTKSLSSVHHFPEQRPVTICNTNDAIYAGNFDLSDGSRRIMKSVDGGYTWWAQSIVENQFPNSSIIRQIECLNDTICFALSEEVIYKTTNAGGPLIEQVGIAFSSLEENEGAERDLKIYPNPASDVVHIQSAQKIKQIQVLDFSGKVLLTDNNGDSFIDVSHLSSGIYLLQLKTENGTVVRKLVKE